MRHLRDGEKIAEQDRPDQNGVDRDRSSERFDKAVEQFKIAAAAFPENRVVKMYLGEPLSAERRYANDCGAPEWAALQREGLERLADVVEWWIDHRLQPNGEYAMEPIEEAVMALYQEMITSGALDEAAPEAMSEAAGH